MGNIYKAKVLRILPGINACFVDVGRQRNAFLSFADIPESLRKSLQIGKEILVQVIKGELPDKACRVSANISLSGRYTVLLPFQKHYALSRKIESQEERRRLKELAKRLIQSVDEQIGVIIRTAAEGHSDEEITRDFQSVYKLWKELRERALRLSAPVLLYRDFALHIKLARDVFDESFNAFIVDNETYYNELKEYLNRIAPHLAGRISYFKSDKELLFDFYGVNDDPNELFTRKIWLPSGGFLMIDYAEAMTVIDVNSGSYTESEDLESTALTINTEAAREIARQLRLRNLSGIISIDFIDMREDRDKQKVIEVLKEELDKDKEKSLIVGFTNLGVLEMTRRRRQNPFYETMGQVCPHCYGVGYVIKPYFMATKVLSDIFRKAAKAAERFIYLEISPKLMKPLISDLNLLEVADSLDKTLIINVNSKLDYRRYKIKLYRNLRNLPADELPTVNEKVEVELLELDEDNFARAWGIYQRMPVLIENFKRVMVSDTSLKIETRIRDVKPYALLIGDFISVR